MLFVLYFRFGIYQNVIPKHYDKLIHEFFKHTFMRHVNVVGAFVRPKGYYYICIMLIPSPESNLIGVFIFDVHLMIA